MGKYSWTNINMSDEKGLPPSLQPPPGLFPCTVVEVIDDYTVVINRGSRDGIRGGQRFVIYAQSSEQIRDPESGELLGYLEIVKGTGKVTHLQERLATVESDKTDEAKKRVI